MHTAAAILATLVLTSPAHALDVGEGGWLCETSAGTRLLIDDMPDAKGIVWFLTVYSVKPHGHPHLEFRERVVKQYPTGDLGTRNALLHRETNGWESTFTHRIGGVDRDFDCRVND